jgi:anhydro-N-acetylmuramic acid kinase
MSGTSLDGLDIAFIRFTHTAHRSWTFEIQHAETYAYPMVLQEALAEGHTLSGEALAHLDVQLGTWMGNQVSAFIRKYGAKPGLIASHGHTIFHQPEKGLSLQIGNPHHLAAISRIPVIADFRQGDVALGGQGAPLVPIGDALLFDAYHSCINLGGFSNISLQVDGIRKAFDICPCNMPLNAWANRLGMPYDSFGGTARKGNILEDLLRDWNALSFYDRQGPKSLGKEWYERSFAPLASAYVDRPQDVLRTLIAHISEQISAQFVRINDEGPIRHLVTGGGAHNAFLLEEIQAKLPVKHSLILPDAQLIDYKEALIFGFMGLLRQLGKINILSSVTGASQDSCGGIIFMP